MVSYTDIMMGNYLHVCRISKLPPMPIQVKSFGEDGVNLLWDHEMTNYKYKYEDLFPIPLTQEILSKNGFKSNTDSWWEKDGFQLLKGWSEEFGDFYHFSVDHLVVSTAFKYVHQLQNMWFVIMGTQLEINF